MILLPNQISNLKYDNYLKNQRKSVNTVLKDTIVGTAVKVATWSKTFEYAHGVPSVVDKYRRYKTSGSYSGRAETKWFDINENNVFTFTNPTTYSYMEVSYSTQHRYARQAYGSENRLNTTYNTDASMYIYGSNKERIDGLLEKTEILSSAPALTALEYNKNYTMYAPTNDTYPFTVKQNGLYSFTLKGTQPCYTAFGSNKSGAFADDGYRPYTQWEFNDYFLQSITIDMYAQTVVSEDVNFSSSNETPSLEITSSELLQYNATHDREPLYNYIASQIVERNSEGRMLVSFTLQDEKIDIEQGSLIQIKNKFGNLIKKGATFEVYQIQYNIGARLLRDIKAVEVPV